MMRYPHYGSGRAKLILFGEYAALYGAPALGIPLPFQTELLWSPQGPPTDPPETAHMQGMDRKKFLSLLQQAQKFRENFCPRGGTWYCRNQVPRTGGFGSSAALCIALSRALFDEQEEEYHYSVHDFAHFLEKEFHGKASGIDTGISGDKTAAIWYKGSSRIPSRQSFTCPPWNILYAALPRRTTTAQSIKTLDHRYASGDLWVRKACTDLGEIAQEFIELAQGKEHNASPLEEDPSFPSLAALLVNRAQETLCGLELSTPALDTLFIEAKKLGALGGKISGAGQGGAFYLCAKNRQDCHHIRQELPKQLEKNHIRLATPLREISF